MATRPSIIHLITELGYASERDLQEVQVRQVIYGGDQESNLLELGLVSEDQLLSALAIQSDLPCAPPGPMSLEVEATRKLTEKGLRIAMGQSAEGAFIAYVDHVPESGEYQMLLQEYGDESRFVITTRLRLSEAIATAQGQTLSARDSALLARLGKHAVRKPSFPVAALIDEPSEVSSDRITPIAQAPSVLRPVSAKASAFDEQAPTSRGETAPPPLGYEDIAASAAVDVQRGSPQSAHSVRHIYNRADAEQDLHGAKNRDRVVDILLHFAAAHFEYTAVFGILSKEARGLKASGPGASTEALRALHIPLDLPSVLRQVLNGGVAQVSRLRASGLEGGITRDLKRSSGTDVFLLPISVAHRPVLLLWGDNSRHRITLDEFRDLTDFGDFVSKALEHVLIERKRASRVAQPSAHLNHLHTLTQGKQGEDIQVLDAPDPFLSIPPETIESSAATEVRASTTALSIGNAPHRAPLESVPPSSTPISPRPPRRQTQRNSAAPAPGNAAPVNAAPAAPEASGPLDHVRAEKPDLSGAENNLSQSAHEVSEAKKRTLTRPGQGPERTDSDRPSGFPLEAPRTLRGFPEVRAPSLTPGQSQEPGPLVPRIHITGEDGPTRPREPLLSRRIVPLSAPPPARVADEVEVVEAPAPPGLPPTKTETNPPAPLSTPSFASEPRRRSSTMMSRVPVPEPDADGWGSPSEAVVRRVDPIEPHSVKNKQSYSDLVQQLLDGNTKVIPRLVDGGETAVGALIAQFPGPVCAPARPTTKASECGPILEALAALGSKATPF